VSVFSSEPLTSCITFSFINSIPETCQYNLRDVPLKFVLLSRRLRTICFTLNIRALGVTAHHCFLLILRGSHCLYRIESFIYSFLIPWVGCRSFLLISYASALSLIYIISVQVNRKNIQRDFLFCFKFYGKDYVNKYVSNFIYGCKLNWYEFVVLFYVSIWLHVCISKANYKYPLNNYWAYLGPRPSYINHTNI